MNPMAPVMRWQIWSALALSASLVGCANFVETRAITAFSEALQEQDRGKLMEQASSRFEQKALRLDESIDDFAVLRLPKGDINVVSVTEVTDTEKRVEVEVGERMQRMKYRLIREPNSRKWVVDDIQIRQKKGNLVATRSVSELMDLITSVREFLKAWDSSDRQQMVNFVTADLGEILKDIPPEYVANMARQVIGDRAHESKIKPEAQIDEESAVVRLPRKSGQMLISFSKEDGQWLISDLAVESKAEKDHVPSVKQLATAIRSSVTFLDAYNASHREDVAAVCKPSLYRNCLASADWTVLKLPTSRDALGDYSVRLESGLADFVVTGPREIVRLKLVKVEGEDSQAATKYLVEDVSIHDLAEKQEKRLSALFMSQGVVEAFAEGLALRDRDLLRALASTDFKQRVWDRMDEDLLQRMPMAEIENAVPQVMTTVFNGKVTEITVKQGSGALVYSLSERDGKLYVDDILMSVLGRPASLKQTLDVMVSVAHFMQGLSASDVPALTRASSRDFNRQVWANTEHVPTIGINPFENMQQPLVTMDVEGERATVGLGDDRFGARISLAMLGERFVVDDVILISGRSSEQQVSMKNAMKAELSRFRGQAK